MPQMDDRFVDKNKVPRFLSIIILCCAFMVFLWLQILQYVELLVMGKTMGAEIFSVATLSKEQCNKTCSSTCIFNYLLPPSILLLHISYFPPNLLLHMINAVILYCSPIIFYFCSSCSLPLPLPPFYCMTLFCANCCYCFFFLKLFFHL